MAYKFPTDPAILVLVMKVHPMLCGVTIVLATFLHGTARLATLLFPLSNECFYFSGVIRDIELHPINQSKDYIRLLKLKN